MPPIPQAALAILRETDALRLSLRSIAYAEEVFTDALELVLPSAEGKSWAKGLKFRRKLDFAVALRIVPPGARRGLEELAKLRNEQAHSIHPPLVTMERVEKVVHAWRELIPSFAADDTEPAAPASTPEPPEGAIPPLVAALLSRPVAPEIARLRDCCSVAVVIAEFARERASEMYNDRETTQRNRLFRQYVESRRAQLHEEGPEAAS